jgi:hypothetical protein
VAEDNSVLAGGFVESIAGKARNGRSFPEDGSEARAAHRVLEVFYHVAPRFPTQGLDQVEANRPAPVARPALFFFVSAE